MVCVYCANQTRVANSRTQKRTRQTWRRRHCLTCGAIFTTLEAVDLSASIRVVSARQTYAPFLRDKLFLSITKSLGHRIDAAETASALTATCISKLLPQCSDATVSHHSIKTIVYETLSNFDKVAAISYAAYHQMPPGRL